MIAKGLRTILVALVGLVVFGPDSGAQESATIQAVATVVSTLSITGSSNLDFGVVTPGVNKSVDKADVGPAGEFSISGITNAEITLDFTLPANLTSGVANLPTSFSSSDASWDDGTGGGQTAPAGVINPNIMNTLRIGAGGELTAWIGGRVSPTISQTGGNYTGNITLTIAYTGG